MDDMSREPLSRERIAELRALLEKATPGPWPGDYVYSAMRHVARNCYIDSDEQPDFSWDKYVDSPLVTALVNEADALLAAAERVVALEGLLRDILETARSAKLASQVNGVRAEWLIDRIEAALRAENGGKG